VISALAACLALGCAHGEGAPGFRQRPGTADARFAYYADDEGLSVVTAGAAFEQPVSRHVSVLGQMLVDRILVQRSIEIAEDTGGQPTGHLHDDLDAVTSASVTVTGGNELEKVRYEGTLGGALDVELGGAPTRLQIAGRASHEPDYDSLTGRLSMTTELAERNTTVSAFLGYGHDESDPIEAPPGEGDQWPATHQRWNGGATVSQTLSRRLVLSAGAAASLQEGTLESPYRRALVRTSLFPEAVPDDRLRATAFVGLAWYLGWDMAVHLQQGGYADSWDVKAFIPQVAIAKQIMGDGLVSLRYRYYGQSAASFYEPRYQDLEDSRSSDARLGDIREHLVGGLLRWTVLGTRGDFGALSLEAGYDLSLLRYAQIGHSLIAHIVAVGVSGSY
jgi:hypothetical protein